MVNQEYLGLHRADSTNLRAHLQSKGAPSEPFVDAIITSPPYADLQEYGDGDEQVGNQPYEEFLESITTVFKQCFELSASDATLWVNTDTFRRGGRIVRLPFDIADELENLDNKTHCEEPGCPGRLHRDRGTGELVCEQCGTTIDPLEESWRHADHIIWDKKRTRPWYPDGKLRNVYEHLSMYSKTENYKYNIDAVRETDTEEFGRWWVDYPERYNPNGKVPDNLWEFPIPKQGQWGPKLAYHPSPFPMGLVERIIRLATDPGDVVLDPFAGVGTTLAIAKHLDRKPIGFELNEEYIDYYHDHVLEQAAEHLVEQQTLQTNQKEKLRYTIWTLRTHKFAFELQRELLADMELDVSRDDLNAVFIIADQDAYRQDSPPSVELYFIFEDANIAQQISMADIQDHLLSNTSDSGNYYQVEFDLHTGATSEWQIDGGPNHITAADLSELFVYTDSDHFWYQEQLTIDDWIRENQSGGWKRYIDDIVAPVISTLNIRVSNPLQETDDMQTSKQSVLGEFDR